MTCAEKGDALYFKVGKRWRKVYFVEHDPDARKLVHVLWKETRHISRVPLRQLRRDSRRSSR